jgi:hypothetical protein
MSTLSATAITRSNTHGGARRASRLVDADPCHNSGRTLARPVNGGNELHCDIGAYEYLAKIPQTIAFSPLADKTFGDPSFSVSVHNR